MKLAHINSIRGIAILMVISVHVSLITKGVNWVVFFLSRYGQMGVQLFFVASAFTLCLSHDRRLEERLPNVKFAIRRFFRIAPAYYLGIVFYSIFQWISPYKEPGTYPNSVTENIISVIWNVLFLHGLIPSANNHVVPGGWSIGNEMLFYCLFPALFSRISKHPMTFGRSFAWIVLFVLIACCWSLFGETMYGVGVENGNFFYYSIFNQLPVFIIGICYYFLWKSNKLNLPIVTNLTACLLFTLGALFLFKYDSIPGNFVLMPIVSAVSFVFLIECFRKISFLNIKLLQRIGTTSYSMYLVHFFFVFIAAKFFINDIKNKLGADLAFVGIYLIIVFLTFMCALLLERWLEKPSINLGKKLIKLLSYRTRNETL